MLENAPDHFGNKNITESTEHYEAYLAYLKGEEGLVLEWKFRYIIRGWKPRWATSANFAGYIFRFRSNVSCATRGVLVVRWARNGDGNRRYVQNKMAYSERRALRPSNAAREWVRLPVEKHAPNSPLCRTGRVLQSGPLTLRIAFIPTTALR